MVEKTLEEKLDDVLAINKKLQAENKKLKGTKRSGTYDEGESFIENAAEVKRAFKSAFAPTEELSGPVSAIFDSFKNFRLESKAFFESGYTGQMDSFAKAISAANAASHKLNASFTAAKAATTAFRDNFRGMIFASTQMQESLMKTSVVMQGAGWDLNQYASIVESATMAFNKTETEVENMTATLLEVQKTLAVSPKELAKNFRSAQQNMGYSAKKIEETFIGLQKMSRTTGVSFDKLASAFGGSMDKFGGSAQKAGQLNQILGKSVFNSMELLNMTEKERAEKIRGAIMESGRSVKEMGKFELLALNDTLGFNSVEDTRKFLRGDLAMGSGPGGAYQKMKDAKIKPSEDIKTQKLETALEEMTRGIRNTRPALLDFQINLKSALNLGVRKHLFPQGPWTARGQTEDQAVNQLQAHTIYGSRTAQAHRGLAPGLGLENPQLTDPTIEGFKNKMQGPISTGATYAIAKTITGTIGKLTNTLFGAGATRMGQASALAAYAGGPATDNDLKHRPDARAIKKEIQKFQSREQAAINQRREARYSARPASPRQFQPSSPESRLISANERTATAIESLVNMARQPGGLPAGVGD